MRKPTVREQDMYLRTIGVEPFTIDVERVDVAFDNSRNYKDGKGDYFATMYYYERGGEMMLALHWPETAHEEMT